MFKRRALELSIRGNRPVFLMFVVFYFLKYSYSLRQLETRNKLHLSIIPTTTKWQSMLKIKSNQKDFNDNHNIRETTHIKNNFVSQKSFLPSASAEQIAFLLVYFVQGIISLSRLALTFFLKDQLKLSPAETASILAFSSIPWIFKPLYGFLSDSVPILGYKRRSYLILSGLIGSISWIGLSSFIDNGFGVILATTLGSLSIAISDVVVDSMVVERSSRRIQNLGENTNDSHTKVETKSSLVAASNLQSLCWASSSVGAIVSAYFSGSLLEFMSPQSIFLITATFPLIISLSSFLIVEDKVVELNDDLNRTSQWTVFTDKLKEIYKSLSSPDIYLPVLFIFLWQATPTADSAMFYFYTNNLGFSPTFLGKVRLFSSVASLCGVLAYRTWLKEIPVRSILFYSALVSAPLGLSQLLLTTHANQGFGIPDEVFTLTDSVVLSVLGQISFMPILALATALCPPGVEGTLFATLMSIFNAAGLFSSELGSILTGWLGITENNFENLSLLIAICSISSWLPLIFINKLLMSDRLDGSADNIDSNND